MNQSIVYMANSLKINPWRSKYGHAEMIFSLNNVELQNLILKILCFFSNVQYIRLLLLQPSRSHDVGLMSVSSLFVFS